MSDEDLLAAADRGDAEAFAVFYRRHVAGVTAFLRRRVATPEVAFDLAAETFAHAVRGLSSFRPKRGTARGWLFGIAANELRQAWRRGEIDSRARRRLAMEPIALDDDALRRVEELAEEGAARRALATLRREREPGPVRRLGDSASGGDLGAPATATSAATARARRRRRAGARRGRRA